MAYEYAVSFEIKSDTTYSERYQSFMDEIRNTPGEPYLWSETTSFVLLTSNEKIDDLEHRLYYNSKLNSAKDKLLVIDHHSGVAVARGPFEYPATLKSHFKSCVVK
ncbi:MULTISPECIES: hypothetical protein [unclassified Sphingopyxis]|jgi:hypothetical protein|uniref:hypothetical protein n=1 Tax=unclassified Sphingopyxis TaxID=2614943 RepID=UPI0025FCCD91|nr:MULTISPECIES: hypothetical protein [unclassified Sphingopyxis]